jgi:DNA replication protein DnaC
MLQADNAAHLFQHRPGHGRTGRASTLIASQIPIADWHAAIGDATLADAILDRLVHNAYRIELKGDSMRKNNAKIRQQT